MIRRVVGSCSVNPQPPKPYIQRRFKLQQLRNNLHDHELKGVKKTMDELFEEMSETTWPENICRPLPTSIVKHVEPVGFEFAIETSDSIKHYVFEDV